MRFVFIFTIVVLVTILAYSVSLNLRYQSRMSVLLEESRSTRKINANYEGTPSVYYLHVYTHRYRPSQDSEHPHHDAGLPNSINTRIGTVSVSPEIPFYYNAPIDRDPELIIRGDIKKDGQLIDCNFSIWIDDPGTTFEYKHEGSVELNKLIPYWNDYFFSVSTHENPYLLPAFNSQLRHRSLIRSIPLEFCS